jgi:hypothetical protein
MKDTRDIWFWFWVYSGAWRQAYRGGRGYEGNLVLLLIQDCAVGVDNMFKAELFELFAIFPAAHATRGT